MFNSFTISADEGRLGRGSMIDGRQKVAFGIGALAFTPALFLNERRVRRANRGED